MARLTHLDARGQAHMVDVSAKAATLREAIATAKITMSADAYDALKKGDAKKGDVLSTARLAGIMAAKRTAELIPLCHPLPLTKIAVDFVQEDAARTVVVTTLVKTRAETGVEMEALAAASVAALTIYDMLKANDKAMVIGDIKLLKKTGGKSGPYVAAPTPRRAGRKR